MNQLIHTVVSLLILFLKTFKFFDLDSRVSVRAKMLRYNFEEYAREISDSTLCL